MPSHRAHFAHALLFAVMGASLTALGCSATDAGTSVQTPCSRCRRRRPRPPPSSRPSRRGRARREGGAHEGRPRRAHGDVAAKREGPGYWRRAHQLARAARQRRAVRSRHQRVDVAGFAAEFCAAPTQPRSSRAARCSWWAAASSTPSVCRLARRSTRTRCSLTRRPVKRSPSAPRARRGAPGTKRRCSRPERCCSSAAAARARRQRRRRAPAVLSPSRRRSPACWEVFDPASEMFTSVGPMAAVATRSRWWRSPTDALSPPEAPATAARIARHRRGLRRDAGTFLRARGRVQGRRPTPSRGHAARRRESPRVRRQEGQPVHAARHADVRDPTSGQWTLGPTAGPARTVATLVPLQEGGALVFGGLSCDNDGCTAPTSVQVWSDKGATRASSSPRRVALQRRRC